MRLPKLSKMMKLALPILAIVAIASVTFASADYATCFAAKFFFGIDDPSCP